MNRLFGGLAAAVGLLMMTGSGLCSFSVIFLSLHGLARVEYRAEILMSLGTVLLALGLGGSFFFLGLMLFRSGRKMIREATDADAE